MIKDNQKLFNYLHLVLDGLVVIISYFLSYYLKFATGFSERDPNVGTLDAKTYFSVLIIVVPMYVLLYYMFNMYAPKRATMRRYELFGIFKANTVGIVLLMMILYLVEQYDISRSLLAIFYTVNIILTTLVRTLIRNLLQRFRRKGYNLKHVLLVGYSTAAEEYITRINHNPQWGYSLIGVLDDTVPRGTIYKGVKVVGSIDNLKYILSENKLDEVAITIALKDYDKLADVVDVCEKFGVHTKFIPDYTSLVPSNPYTEDVLGLPVINIRYVPLNNALNAFIKRVMDIVGSLLGIVISSPVMLVCIAAIKLTSPGPIIFKQERIGLHNKPFKMYKFRSMEVQRSTDEEQGWTTKNDPRVTKVGRFIRKTSIDELPQLFNILLGDMSLVGPRPERPQFVEKFKEEIPRYMIKHQVRPGLTGWAQVNGYRGDTSIRKRIEYDLYYIENWSASLDIKIMFMTVFKGFVNKNAY